MFSPGKNAGKITCRNCEEKRMHGRIQQAPDPSSSSRAQYEPGPSAGAGGLHHAKLRQLTRLKFAESRGQSLDHNLYTGVHDYIDYTGLQGAKSTIELKF